MFVAKVVFQEVNGVPRTAVAGEPIRNESVVCSIKDGKISKERGRFTIQVGENMHIEGPGVFFHSCEPNCYWNFKDLALVARRDISKGEPISFDYCTTEYTLVNNFECKCGSPNCYGMIRGFKHLTAEQKKNIEHALSPFLKRILDAEKEIK